MAKAMKEAQFVLTNPSHFSVAMAYDPLKAAAPVVLAKGRGEKGAGDARSRPPNWACRCSNMPALARSVYFTTRENGR
jgi:flagellar biosynthetic protein FlhB